MRKKLARATALLLAAVLTAVPPRRLLRPWALKYTTVKHSWRKGRSTPANISGAPPTLTCSTERYLEYSPNEAGPAAVAYGDTVLDKKTLTALAQDLENEGKRVLGGVNGDYFVLATGAPLGMVVTDGVLRSSSSYVYALGFDADGNAFIGKPELSITATFGNATYAVPGPEQGAPDTGGFVLLLG